MDMEQVLEMYGMPDYKTYPVVGYSYSVLARIVEDRDGKQRDGLEAAVAFSEMNESIEKANAEPSHLDNGYMVYAILRDTFLAHIGVHAGRNTGVIRRHNPIRDAKKKYGDGCVFIILKYGLSQRQALQIQQTLKRRFSIHSFRAS
jgi:hypothetical protein